MANKDISDKKHKCQQCEYTSHWATCIKRHISSVHEGLKPILCALCGARFSTKKTMKNHIESIHGEGKGQFLNDLQTSV